MSYKVRRFMYWWRMRLRNPWKALLVEFRIIVLAFCSTRRLNLGDIVRYNNKRYILTQGVCSPSWNIVEWLPKADRHTRKCLEYIHQDDFKKERSFANFWHDLSFTHRFYAGYWRDIWEGFPVRDIVQMSIALWSKRRVSI